MREDRQKARLDDINLETKVLDELIFMDLNRFIYILYLLMYMEAAVALLLCVY